MQNWRNAVTGSSAGLEELKERKKLVVEYLVTHPSITIGDFEALCPDVNRRTLQRELKELVDAGILSVEGKTNQREYKLST